MRFSWFFAILNVRKKKSDIIVFCCADFQQEYFSEKDFREKTSIDGNLLKDIWDEVQEPRYM